MATIGTLTAKINADTSNLQRGLRKAERRMDKFARRMRRVGMMAGAALSGIGAGAYHLVNMASEAEELNNVMQQSFGDMAKTINNWASETGEAMNRSTFQMRKFVAMNQAIIKPMLGTNEQTKEMSKNLTKLAVDMASFFETADKQAFEAIQSGLMGMVEPLRQFGIDMTQATLKAYALEKGIEANIQEMSQAEKIQIRYNYLMENTAHIQGDAVRTAGSFANRVKGLTAQLDNLGREMGNYFLPIAKNIVAELTEAAEWFNDLDDVMKTNIAKWTVLGSGVLGAIATFALFVTAIQMVVKSIAFLASIVGLIFSPTFLAIAALAAVAFTLYTAWQENWLGIQEIVEGVWEELEPIFKDMRSNLDDNWDWFIQVTGSAWLWLTDTTWQQKLKDMKGWLTDGWKWVVNLVKEGATKLWDWIGEVSPGTQGALKTVWEWGLELTEWLSSFFYTVWEWIKAPAKTTWEWLADLIGTAIDWIKNTAWPWIDETATTAWEWTVNATGNFWEFMINNWKAIKDFFADGETTWDFKFEGRYKEPYGNQSSLQNNLGLSEQAKRDIALMTKLEAGGEPFKGQAGVAEVIINRLKSEDFPNTVEKVLKQSGQFEPVDEWKRLRDSNVNLEQQLEAVKKALQDDIIGDAVYFGNLEIIRMRGVDHPLLNPSRVTAEIGQHTFGKQKGGMTAAVGKSTPAGVVHGGEWVMPAWMVDRFPQLATMLEGMRKNKGYKAGGSVGSLQAGGDVSFAGMNFKDMQGYLQEVGKGFDQVTDTFVNAMKTLSKVIVEATVTIAAAVTDMSPQEIRNKMNNMIKGFNDLFKTNVITGEGGTGIGAKGEGNFSKTSNTFGTLIEKGKELGNTLIDRTNMGRQLVNAWGQGGFLGVAMSLIQESAFFSKIIEMINPILQDLADIVGAVLMPVMLILAPILEIIGKVFDKLATVLVKFWNGLMDIISKIPLVDVTDWKIALDDATDTTEDFNNAMRNVPSGFKVALRRFQATQPRDRTRGRIPIETGRVASLSGNTSNDTMQGDTFEVNINGDVYGIDDLERKIEQTMATVQRRQSMSKYGVEGGV